MLQVVKRDLQLQELAADFAVYFRIDHSHPLAGDSARVAQIAKAAGLVAVLALVVGSSQRYLSLVEAVSDSAIQKLRYWEHCFQRGHLVLSDQAGLQKEIQWQVSLRKASYW